MEESDCQSKSYVRVWRGDKVEFQTARAKVTVLETADFGKTIFLDGEIQSCAADEAMYHETLTRPALVCSSRLIENVLIVGGGELCTLRNVLTWPAVKSVTMIDYDGEFVEWCKSNLTSWHGGAHLDPRVKIYHEDIFTTGLLDDGAAAYDAIILDMTDISLNDWEGDVAAFGRLFVRLLPVLAPGGAISMYLGMWIPYKSAAMRACIEAMTRQLEDWGRPLCVQPYRRYIPSFGTGEALFAVVSEVGWPDAEAWGAGGHFDLVEARRAAEWSPDTWLSPAPPPEA